MDKPRSTLWLHTPQAVFLSELLAEYRHRQNLQNRYSCSSNHALHFRLAQGLVGKGYGVRASEYGLAPPTIQVRNIRTDTHSIP